MTPVPTMYPGVYLQVTGAFPSTITPVSTGIAAFVGRTPGGPMSAPAKVHDFADYSRSYGGLALDFPLSYAVQDFFANGGSEALICRLFAPTEGSDGLAQLQFASASGPALVLVAASPGTWGNALAAGVDRFGIFAETVEQFSAYGLTVDDVFNLTLTVNDAEGRTVASERFINVTVRSDGDAANFPKRLDRMLEQESRLARVSQLSAVVPSTDTAATGSGGNDGAYLTPEDFIGDPALKTGLHALYKSDGFNLLCIPPDLRIASAETAVDLPDAVRQAAAEFCMERRAFFIVDPPAAWIDLYHQGRLSTLDPTSAGIKGHDDRGNHYAASAAVYFPRIVKQDPMAGSRPTIFSPCGAVAGIIAATDVALGVWKAPAGLSAGLAGIAGLECDLSDAEDGMLNSLGVNCLRSFPTVGPIVWGARTLRGDDAFEDDFKYVPVRRLVCFIESSILRGTQWAVFEPNTEVLWSSLRLAVWSFLADLSRQEAFYDYNVTCDATTTTPDDVASGFVTMIVRIAPVKPGEFICISIRQAVGATAS